MRRNSLKLIKELFRVVLASVNDHWLIKTVIGLFPAIAAFALAFQPVQNLFISDNSLNFLGVIVLIIAVLCLLINGFSNVISSHDKDDLSSYVGENQIHRKVAETEAAYERDRNEILRNAYKTLAYDENNLGEFILHYVNPKRRTYNILTQISCCMADECDVSSNEIVLSAIVKCDSDEWDWLCPPDFEGMGNLEDLVNNGSALFEVIEHQTYFYANDKRTAIEQNKYVPDRRDATNGNKGSIICWEVATEIVHENHYKKQEKHSLRMIVSISTYGTRLIEVDAKEEKINGMYEEVIQKMILERFRGELNESLIWYGLQHLR